MYAEMILTNGRVYTGNPLQPWAEALACDNGRLIMVGTNAEALALADEETRRLDAEGRLVLPGLIDAHIHFLQVAIRRQQVRLFGVTDFGEAMRRVEDAVQNAGPGQWVVGWGYDAHYWEGVEPSAALLDKIAPDTPVVLAQMDMHSWWANSAAMRVCGIDASTPDYPNSTIERDADGNPIGIFREWNAIELLRKHLPEPEEETLYQWLQEAQAEAHALGFTGIHDQRVEQEGAQSFRLWQRLEQEEMLKMRVHMHIAADYIHEAKTLGLRAGFGSERLWVGHVKAFADGAMGSHTARMIEPYEGEPNNLGLVVKSNEELWDFTRRAGEAGFSMCVHAIGDQAVRDVLSLFDEHLSTPGGQTLTMPHRIEHVQIMKPEDLPLFNNSGIVASMQPYHLMTDWQTANKIWGERTRYSFPMRSILDQGGTLAFGSDAPVAPMDPMAAIYAAVTRKDTGRMPQGGWQPQEALTIPEAVEAYTIGPAMVSGKTALQGSLIPGKWADFIVLSQNLFEIDPEQIMETEVDVTVFASEVVYHR